MNLFESATAETGEKNQPLAYRMRPRSLEEYIGQEHIIGKGRLLRRAIQADQLSSVIFYGPPGTGKTTLARVIANTTKRHFSTLNAVLSGVKELRYEIEEAKSRLDHYNQRTILFVDEVHRWNKSQQDALLPWVENGTIILIGATTENPYFEVNAALVSRSRIFQLKSLTDKDLHNIVEQTINDKERGYGAYRVSFEQGAKEHLVEVANGDARSLLNALQLAVETSVEVFPPPLGTAIFISKEAAEESIQQKAVLYDKEGDYHFDVISAFIKSVRGSDPDASLYWLAKMVSAGEDPKFIFRRMLISACEDVGLADPQAIVVVEADAQAFERIGFPEGRFHLTHAALYLATAPKSNSTLGFFDALKGVEQEARAEVPNHLRDGNRDAKGFGHGEGYLYPHAYQDHWVAQQYLPSSLQGKVFYQPGKLGYEKQIHDQVLERREEQLESSAPDAFVENLTYSPGDKERQQWLSRTTSERGAMLQKIRNELFSSLHFKRSDRVLVVNAGHGLLLWEAYRRTPEGFVVAQVNRDEQFEHINHYAKGLDAVEQPMVVKKPIAEVLASLEPGLKFEKIMGRNLLSHLVDDKGLLGMLSERISEEGILSIAETIPSQGSRLSQLVPPSSPIKQKLAEAEARIYGKQGSSLANWSTEDLAPAFQEFGWFSDIQEYDLFENRFITQNDISRWIGSSYSKAWDELGTKVSLAECLAELNALLAQKSFRWKHHTAIIRSARTLGVLGFQKDDATALQKGVQAWKETEAKSHFFK
ncbi:AAA ATPase [Sphaerochaeta pleomorpha str. Grapes]|uniref:Replication-associated recombination protein A n=1 Tax=Sphaerochaeta pleomorpha (strain ATCC BAA-1885 / DSM 22778 / Grapes) TaxID=158190 RepID=G8QQ47_SPHPG|nr:AAA family ATPase [Sphaerochaeta pleomorpha]AEV28624.1 AAA ATPase [Sphaerochaeta pleomorpha str. Grapes]